MLQHKNQDTKILLHVPSLLVLKVEQPPGNTICNSKHVAALHRVYPFSLSTILLSSYGLY